MQRSFLFDTLLPKMEVIGWVVAIIGLAGKWWLLAGGSMMLIVGLSTLSVVYFLSTYAPARIKEEDALSEGHRKPSAPFAATSNAPSFLADLLLPKVINMSSAVLLIGMLFKLMSWNGSQMMLMVGESTLFTAVILLLLNQRMHVRALVLVVLGGLLMYISADDLVRQFHRNDPVLVEKMIYRNHHPRDRAAQEAVREHLRQQRDQRYN
ncbi:hypothetical protein Q5H92_06815 [Hymenobacter sp. M29]|uniref:Gliding motility protein GldL-like N-terminal domain-containing protein n=1 Tax=Hymenobacter mellowenesis TaxID=3063995 RepID=A0ABT9A890_9BACT|nr:hypothetical protein [Hymenobacter sp. M29]MDO7846059.1 hypothetical protein [Hymenobacter sp. M29]